MKDNHLILCLILFMLIIVLGQSYHVLQGHHIVRNDYNLRSNQVIAKNQSDRKSQKSIGGGSIFAGFILGPLLFIMAFVFIWYNEKKAAIQYRRLKLAQQICHEVNPYKRQQIGQAHYKLTHVTGQTNTNEIIIDRISGVSAQNSIKLLRCVQVMEWRATVHTNDNHRSVDYHLGWQNNHMGIVEDRRNDPSCWFINSEEIMTNQVMLGQYIISQSQKKKCIRNENVPLQIYHGVNIVKNTNRMANPTLSDGYIYFPSPNGGNNDHGALRVTYSRCPIGPIAIFARTKYNTFDQFPIAQYEGQGEIQRNQLPACCCVSNCIAQILRPLQTIELVEQKLMSREQIIDKEVQSSKCYRNIIRVVTFFMMVGGICLFFSPITNLMGYIPFVGGFFAKVIGFVIFLAAVLICIPLYILALSISWLFFHPKVGIIILGIGIILLATIIILSHVLNKNHDSQSQQMIQHFLFNRLHSHTF